MQRRSSIVVTLLAISGASLFVWVVLQYVRAYLRTSDAYLLVDGAGFALVLLMVVPVWLIRTARLDRRLGLGIMVLGSVLGLELVTYPAVKVGNTLAILLAFACLWILSRGRHIGVLALSGLFALLAWPLVSFGWMDAWAFEAALFLAGLMLLFSVLNRLAFGIHSEQ